MTSQVYVAALRLLGARRLTEAQLWTRLRRKGFAESEVRAAVGRCKADGYLDDRLYARLFVDGRTRALGNARLVANLVARGVDREAALAGVAVAAQSELERLQSALEKVLRTRSGISYPSAARALERLGFPASQIYAALRAHAARFGPLAAIDADATAGRGRTIGGPSEDSSPTLP